VGNAFANFVPNQLLTHRVCSQWEVTFPAAVMFHGWANIPSDLAMFAKGVRVLEARRWATILVPGGAVGVQLKSKAP
jgi:hypothetical protein